jgi:hypothetical protein
VRSPVASASVSTTAPAGVSNLVCSTIVDSTYRRAAVNAPAGRIDQCPASSSSIAAKTDGLSNRGRHSQSIEPLVDTSAAECRSESTA